MLDINHYGLAKSKINQLGSFEPLIGDHLAVHFKINHKIPDPHPITKEAGKIYINPTTSLHVTSYILISC